MSDDFDPSSYSTQELMGRLFVHILGKVGNKPGWTDADTHQSLNVTIRHLCPMCIELKWCMILA